jgi:hypothetical protein
MWWELLRAKFRAATVNPPSTEESRAVRLLRLMRNPFHLHRQAWGSAAKLSMYGESLVVVSREILKTHSVGVQNYAPCRVAGDGGRAREVCALDSEAFAGRTTCRKIQCRGELRLGHPVEALQ